VSKIFFNTKEDFFIANISYPKRMRGEKGDAFKE